MRTFDAARTSRTGFNQGVGSVAEHLKNTPPVKAEALSYSWLANHPGDKFNPFDPDPAGALREVYTWISQPQLMTPTELRYPTTHFSQLTEMLRRAIKNAEAA